MTATPAAPPDGAAPTVTVRYPPWMDPGFVVAATSWKVTRYVATADGSAPAVPANPRRIAIGFAPEAAVAGAARWGPSPATDLNRVPGPPPPAGEWYTLFTHGPMVCSEWYLRANPDSNVYVYEIELQ